MSRSVYDACGPCRNGQHSRCYAPCDCADGGHVMVGDREHITMNGVQAMTRGQVAFEAMMAAVRRDGGDGGREWGDLTEAMRDRWDYAGGAVEVAIYADIVRNAHALPTDNQADLLRADLYRERLARLTAEKALRQTMGPGV